MFNTILSISSVALLHCENDMQEANNPTRKEVEKRDVTVNVSPGRLSKTETCVFCLIMWFNCQRGRERKKEMVDPVPLDWALSIGHRWLKGEPSKKNEKWKEWFVVVHLFFSFLKYLTPTLACALACDSWKRWRNMTGHANEAWYVFNFGSKDRVDPFEVIFMQAHFLWAALAGSAVR